MLKHTTSYSRKRPRVRRSSKGGYQLPGGRARTTRRPGASYLNHSQGFGRRRGFRAGSGNARKPYAFIAIGCAFLFFMATVIWYLNRSVDITVNGETVGVRINSTIEHYIEDNNLADDYEAGDLLAVDDSVLERGGGMRYTVTLNGDEVELPALGEIELTGGEELTIEDGGDVYEPHSIQATDIAPTLTVDGTGAIAYVESWGIPGRSEIWTGEVSGKTADRGVVKEVQNAVVQQNTALPAQDKPVVALTFDEGPSSYTRQLLDILEEKGAKATFFLSGDAVEADPSAAAAIAQAGMEIGSNTMSDVALTGRSADEVRTQIAQGFDAIEAATGKRVSLLRAPFAEFDDETWTQAMDLVSAVISWNVDSGDWLMPGADTVVSNVMGSVRSGNIVLLTDSDACGAQLVEALPDLIDRLQEEGYELVTVSELIASDEDLAGAVDTAKVSMPEDASLPVLPDEDAAGDAAAS